MSNRNYKIKNKKKNSKQVVSKIVKPLSYSVSDYGYNSSLKGKGVKLGIIDSGLPSHIDLTTSSKNAVDFSSSDNKDATDYYGHSTMVSGIINSNNPKSIVGVAPSAELYFAKVISGDGICSYNSLVAAILWTIVKKVDIILISLGSKTEYSVFYDSIKKAYNQGICVVAASGDTIGKVDFPAKYKEVLSVGKLSKSKKLKEPGAEAPQVQLPNLNSYTTYLDNKYIKATGSSLLASLVSGLACLEIEELKKKKRKIVPSKIYQKLSSLRYK